MPLVQAETGATLRATKQMQVPMTATRFRRYAHGIAYELEIPVAAGRSCRRPRSRLAASSAASPAARPVGVVACITSYNFPLTNMAGKLGPALAMGNTVVVKPAPQDPLGVVLDVPRCSRKPASRRAWSTSSSGRPRTGRGARRVTARRHGQLHRVDRRRPAHRRGRRPRHEAAADGARRQGRVHRLRRRRPQDRRSPASRRVWGFHSGQICTAPTRVIAQRGIYDQLVDGLKARRPAHEGRRPARGRHASSAR